MGRSFLLAIILLIVLIIFIILWFTSVRVQIVYKRQSENDLIEVEVSVWRRMLRYRFTVDLLQIQSLSQGVKVSQKADLPAVGGDGFAGKLRGFLPFRLFRKMRERFVKLLRTVYDANSIMKWVFKHIRCEKFEWTTTIGLGEAAATGTFTGLIWGIKSAMIAAFAHYITLRTIPRTRVIPDFDSERFDVDFLCILRLRLGNTMVAGIRLLSHYLRRGA
ncbi:DUF2953 domain-containing protein [Aneurinibacillus tyrosinisolvens]|uniref:DUF2953 domain-containing protein n=1 Tax=Aneurinibacillus tyrosinisolvens TaxID=1443435 RepID=UPI00063F5A41|nr:DUF2953 domain-containing protein [Aneurinibacillus tyrosinisolvens]